MRRCRGCCGESGAGNCRALEVLRLFAGIFGVSVFIRD
jgi:hypothetical protein